jgi:hypothetical protein
MRADFGKAFGFAVAAVVVSAGVSAPLAQVAGLAPDPILSRLVGFAVMGAAGLLVIETPVLYAFRWSLRDRVVVPRLVWALIGGVIAMVPVVAMNVPGETLSVKISETLEASSSQPMIFGSEWLPFIIGGGVFGYLFASRKLGVSTAG